MHINYILNLGISKKSYVGSGSFELVGEASTIIAINYEGAGKFELVGNAATNLKYYYAGSGSFEIVGTNTGKIPEKLYTNIKFSVNQVGKTYDNKQYKVLQTQSVGDYPLYVSSNTLQTKVFDNNSLFTDSEISTILSNKYSNEITKYQKTIDYINNKLSTIPLPIDKEFLANIKFNINETFINLVNINNEVISIAGSEADPYYISESEIANQAAALTPPENIGYRVAVNNNLIDKYENKLDIINNKLSGMIPSLLSPIRTNVKFSIKEHGSNGLNQEVNVKEVIGDTKQKYYTSEEKVYAENQLLDDSETSGYFNKIYKEKINTYTKKLEEINGRLNA